MEEPVTPMPSPASERFDASPSSFVEFYRERFAPMVRLAVALTGSESAAEDIVHDAFIRVHARWRDVENPNAYLRAAVVNHCRSLLRRRRRERDATSNAVADGKVAFLGADEMFDALSLLPFRQRAALVLRFYEDLPESDIAEVLDCRVGTVGSLINRGLNQLRRVIDR